MLDAAKPGFEDDVLIVVILEQGGVERGYNRFEEVLAVLGFDLGFGSGRGHLFSSVRPQRVLLVILDLVL